MGPQETLAVLAANNFSIRIDSREKLTFGEQIPHK